MPAAPVRPTDIPWRGPRAPTGPPVRREKQASAASSEAQAEPHAQLGALVVLAVEAAADDVFARRIGIGLGVRELLEESGGHPPVPAGIVDRRSEKLGRINPLFSREAAACIAAVVAVFEAGMPARQELVGNAGRQFQLAFMLPFAVEALLFRRCGQIRRPDPAIIEKVLLQAPLSFEFALIRSPAGLDVQREPDRILVRAKQPVDPLARHGLGETP